MISFVYQFNLIRPDFKYFHPPLPEYIFRALRPAVRFFLNTLPGRRLRRLSPQPIL